MNTPRNNPVINPDDPKWTAYVLGELDEAERAEIERLLETSEEARALVEDLTVATTSMKEELTSLLPLMMTPEQRAAIRSAATPPQKRWFEVFPSRWGLGLAAAAIVVLAVALPVAVLDQFQEAPKAEEVAQQPTATSGKGSADLPVPPQISIVRTDQAKSMDKVVSAGPVAQKQESGPAGNATAAPVLTPEEFARLAQDAPAVAASSTTATPAPVPSITGTVADASGALIPGVTVTATNANTGVTHTTFTNEAGAYQIPSVLAGNYQVKAVLPGFQAQTVTNLPVGPQQTLRVNYTLQVASQSTQVEVQVAADTLLKTEAASVGQVLSQNKVADLPLVGNNVLDLVRVMPGVQDGRQGQQGQQQGQGQGQQQARFQDAQAQLGQQGQQGQGQGQGGQARPLEERALANTITGGAGGRGGGGRVQGVTQGVTPGVSGGVVGGVFSGGTLREGITVAAPPPPPPAGPPPMAVMAPPAGALDRVSPAPNTEAYNRVTDNSFIRTTQENLATFSIDVDTASYANVRRFLNQNQLPPADAVRIEELINYFSYDYAQPTGSAPIAPNMEVAAAPWHPTNRLVRIGIKAREVNANRRPPSNLVFLIDVSGSMNSSEKLPLVKAGLGMLVEQLGENDSVSIVVYAGNSGLVLAPTSGLYKERIRQAIDGLQPGGSTNGASGIQLAYNQATANFLRGGTNRVILMTDGDFNVGITSQGELTRLIEDRARTGVFLSVLGFGMGNYKDSTLERLADQGNGNYAYIDNITEARKVLVEEMSGTLVTVAKDVKIQVDFNPARVEAYRLIGYENRVLRTEDFNNDAKDAGDMGAGHTVTALFEVVPKGGEVPGPSVDPSKYTQAPAARGAANAGAASNELLTLRVRYKLPDGDTSTRMDVPLVDRGTAFARATTDFRFAASVAEFGMILRNSPYKGTSRMDSVLDIAEGSVGTDRNGYRKEFITLVQKARNMIR